MEQEKPKKKEKPVPQRPTPIYDPEVISQMNNEEKRDFWKNLAPMEQDLEEKTALTIELEAKAKVTGESVRDMVSLDLKKKRFGKQASVEMWLKGQQMQREKEKAREAEVDRAECHRTSESFLLNL